MADRKEQRLTGLPVSPGIAMGELRVEARDCAAPAIRKIEAKDIPAEWERFEVALQRTEEEISALKQRVERLSGATEMCPTF